MLTRASLKPGARDAIPSAFVLAFGTEALLKHPKAPDVHIAIATLYHAAGELKQATRILEVARKGAPGDPRVIELSSKLKIARSTKELVSDAAASRSRGREAELDPAARIGPRAEQPACANGEATGRSGDVRRTDHPARSSDGAFRSAEHDGNRRTEALASRENRRCKARCRSLRLRRKRRTQDGMVRRRRRPTSPPPEMHPRRTRTLLEIGRYPRAGARRFTERGGRRGETSERRAEDVDTGRAGASVREAASRRTSTRTAHERRHGELRAEDDDARRRASDGAPRDGVAGKIGKPTGSQPRLDPKPDRSGRATAIPHGATASRDREASRGQASGGSARGRHRRSAHEGRDRAASKVAAGTANRRANVERTDDRRSRRADARR